MRPPSRQFFFLDASFSSSRLRLSPRNDETFLYRPTFANIARCVLFLDIQSPLESNNVSREMEVSRSKHILSRKNLISFFDCARERDVYRRSIILDRLRDKIAVRGDTKERVIPMSRGEYEWRAKTYTRNVSLIHNISLSKIIVTLTAISLYSVAITIGDHIECCARIACRYIRVSHIFIRVC